MMSSKRFDELSGGFGPAPSRDDPGHGSGRPPVGRRGRAGLTALAAGCALLLAPAEAPAHSVWSLTVVFNPLNNDVDSIAQVARGDEKFVVAQLGNPTTGESRLYIKRSDPVGGPSARVDLTFDPSGVDRLTTVDEQYLPTLAIDEGTDVLILAKRDETLYGPTIENPVVDPVSLALSVNPPDLVDDDSAILPKRKHSSLAVNAAAGTVFACWTVDEGDDDVYCRSRDLTSAAWSDPIFALAATAEKEEHASVVVLDDDTRVALFADGTGAADGTNLSVEFFDATNASLGSVALGGESSNWPHLIRAGSVLHATWFDTAAGGDMHYATCDTAFDTCSSGGWTEEPIDDVPNEGKYPQVAVDDSGNVFVAYTHFAGNGNQRVAVNARCAPTSWAGELVDGSEDQENLGGDHIRHSYPAVAYQHHSGKLSVVYARQDAATSEIDGVRAAQVSTHFFNCMCGGPCP